MAGGRMIPDTSCLANFLCRFATWIPPQSPTPINASSDQIPPALAARKNVFWLPRAYLIQDSLKGVSGEGTRRHARGGRAPQGNASLTSLGSGGA